MARGSCYRQTTHENSVSSSSSSASSCRFAFVIPVVHCMPIEKQRVIQIIKLSLIIYNTDIYRNGIKSFHTNYYTTKSVTISSMDNFTTETKWMNRIKKNIHNWTTYRSFQSEQNSYRVVHSATKTEYSSLYYNPTARLGDILESSCPSVCPSICPSVDAWWGKMAQSHYFPFKPIIMKFHIQIPHKSRMRPTDFRVNLKGQRPR